MHNWVADIVGKNTDTFRLCVERLSQYNSRLSERVQHCLNSIKIRIYLHA